MECNKDEALRVKEIAEKKFLAKDLVGAKKFALKAQQLFPALEGINQLIATLDVYIASEIKLSGEKNWYAILNVIATADEETLKKQYRKLALLLHPDKNKSVGAEGAFLLISEAWGTLSDKSKRAIYDKKRNSRVVFQKKNSQPSKEKKTPTTGNDSYNFAKNAASKAQAQKNGSPTTEAAARATQKPKSPTFWTSCKGCKMHFEYLLIYLNKKLLCPTCREPFLAEQTQMPNGQNSSVPLSASGQQPSNGHHNFGNKTATFSGWPNGNNSSAPLPASGQQPSNAHHNFGNETATFSGWPNGQNSSVPLSASGQQPSNAHYNFGNKTASTFSGCNSDPPFMAPSMNRTAKSSVNSGSYLGQNFQRGPFSGNAGTFSATASSANAAQAANICHQDSEKLKKVHDEAQAAARRAEVLLRKNSALKRNASESVTVNTGTSGISSAKRKKGVDDHPGNDKGGLSTKGLNVTQMERMDGMQYNFARKFAKMDVRHMLVEMTKFSITKKLEEWNSFAPEPENAKKGRNMDKNGVKIDGLAHDVADKKISPELKTCPQKSVSKKIAATLQVSNSDNEINEEVTIDVPDSEFHDFDKDRTEHSFETDQLWATYDEEDGMPRYYALIQKIISLYPFKVRIRFLSSKSNSELGPMNWVAAGFAKSCGDFRLGKNYTYDTINIFSHRVMWEKGSHGVVKVFPRKSEVWALYRNWSVDWDENTPDEIIYNYDMVEVLSDYREEQGISVVPLVKVEGFKTVFRRQHDPKEVMLIQKQEMFRFSHQVPSYTLTGEEAENAPKGCYELDPAAASMDLLQVNTETKADSVKEAIE